jgi:colicin import membrane protein
MAVAVQPSWFKSHWPYLFGAVLVHAFIAGLFGLTMIQMQRNAPPPMLAIQATVVDLKALPQPRQAQRERERREAAERKRLEEEQAVKREQEQQAEQERQEAVKRQEQEREQERVREEQLVREKETQERIAKEKAAEEQRAVERKQQAEAERQQKLEAQKAEADRKRVAEIERKQREREEAERKQTAADEQARKAQLADQLAEEEALMKAQSSGAMNRYQLMLINHIERQWNKPPSARAGLRCQLNVSQSPSGAVLRVQIGQCNGDEAVRQSIENAVQRASPLPLPEDRLLFQRELRIWFEPTD